MIQIRARRLRDNVACFILRDFCRNVFGCWTVLKNLRISYCRHRLCDSHKIEAVILSRHKGETTLRRHNLKRTHRTTTVSIKERLWRILEKAPQDI